MMMSGVENLQPSQQREVCFCFSEALGRRGRGGRGRPRGELPLMFQEHQIALEEINMPNESKADYSKHSQQPCVHLK